ncbi:MAG: chromosomal replication initiator protein DnaA [Pseudomonadota bacterium]
MSWEQCLEYLKVEIPLQEFNTWLRPLQFDIENKILVLYAPNKFVVDWVNKKYMSHINHFLFETNLKNIEFNDIKLKVGSLQNKKKLLIANPGGVESSISSNVLDNDASFSSEVIAKPSNAKVGKYNATILPQWTFNNYIEGKCNMLARTAAMQVADYVDTSDNSPYNPFLIYGGVGLGKSHLMHAIGNLIISNNSNAKVVYLNSTKFVQDMVSAFQTKSTEKFKSFYRSVDALLIDDIQFFAGKERSQEEFFHTFNSLLDDQKQIIMTCDTFPKEVDGIEERLKSRFSWGLSVGIEMPDVETRVAILISKATILNFELPQDVAFFIAQNIKSNIRELEGALRSVIATSRITGKKISIEYAQHALHDLLSVHQKQVSLDNIQKVVCEYFKIRKADINSKKRTRILVRPRQLAMFLSKELTNHSLPEIGDFFGGRDHTTVLHANKKITSLLIEDSRVKEDYTNLKKILTI